MAMIDIVYKVAREIPSDATDIRRKTVSEFEEYLRSIVLEMEMADISVSYRKEKSDSGRNSLYINGVLVNKILDGLHIIIPEPDEESCGCDGKSKPILPGRPQLDWDEEYVEDIPDVLMKNAIAKVYADVQSNLINVK